MTAGGRRGTATSREAREATRLLRVVCPWCARSDYHRTTIITIIFTTTKTTSKSHPNHSTTMTRMTCLVAFALLLATAQALKLSTQKPLTQKLRPMLKPVRSTPRAFADFQDGRMDEADLVDEEEPITKELPPVKEQKIPTKATVTAAPELGDNTAVYKLLGSRGTACILFKVDALLAFKFKTTLNTETETDIFVPNSASVSGDCGSGDSASMVLSWQDVSLSVYFTKTPGGERWYVEKVDLFVNTENHKLFEHIKNPGRKIHLSSDRGTQLFPTPVGKSFSCGESLSVALGSGDVQAELLLRDLRVQPFIFRKDEFGPDFVCSPGGASFRDETAPIAVGSTLAIVVLCTITGYGAFRYFKIKKVQYDTME